ncbi:ABC transporter permease [Brevibacillus daliensis]|uniref:ABC transporter permease n=1 Tax=Brevibacillus daliensis TaxID=2892995 RepID=UPI001E360A79|nr:ABC transporter permease subunit [Brevibacillus daliensis]
MNKRGSISLWTGCVIVAFLLVIAVFGPKLAPYDITFQLKAGTEIIDGKSQYVKIPYPPDEKHLLGTDRWGYDMLTRLMYGARYTIFATIAIAFFRLLIGTAVGLTIGLAERKQAWWISLENTWSYVPIFIPIYFMLIGISMNSPLEPFQLTVIFVVLATLLGIPSIVSSVRQKTEQVKQLPFITAAISLGAGREHLILRHVLPQLKEQLLLLFVSEIIVVMALMGQLGIFDLFIGGTIAENDPDIFISASNEWAGLIGQSRTSIQFYAWMFYGPLGAFILAILGFSLIVNGLKRKYETAYNQSPYV